MSRTVADEPDDAPREGGRTAAEPAPRPAYEVVEPLGPLTPFVFNSAHSGAAYPRAFLQSSRLPPHALRRSEDVDVDALFAPAAALGAPLLRAHFPRAYLDCNREPYELDPRMFEGRLPAFANTRSPRVASGLGTVARIVGDGQEIYAGRLPVEEGIARIETLYKPYHAALRRLLERAERRFGVSVLVDAHSMPSSSFAAPGGGRGDRPERADVVLGDRYGTSVAGALVDAIEAAFARRGYAVARNRPYAGGFITEHYGQPAAGRHAVQVEVNRDLYMDERTLARTAGFPRLRHDLAGVFADVIGAWAQGLWAQGLPSADETPRPLAAE